MNRHAVIQKLKTQKIINNITYLKTIFCILCNDFKLCNKIIFELISFTVKIITQCGSIYYTGDKSARLR